MNQDGHSSEQMETGHDIGPDEERLYPVQMISGFHETDHGEMILEYERVFVQRPAGGTFIEPFDETPPAASPAPVRASDPRFHDEKERLQTFSGCWPDVYPVDPASLAKNGFVFIGPGDRVKCVFCLNTLRGWETGDVVEDEHRRHYPDCPFVRGCCGHLNIPIPDSDRVKTNLGYKLKPESTNVEMVPETQQTNVRMQDYSSRLETFHTWPKTCPVSPDHLAAAGFFYTGREDVVQCFVCGKTVKKWCTQDLPFVEHAKLSPRCAFVNQYREVHGTTGAMNRPEPQQVLGTTGVMNRPEPQQVLGTTGVMNRPEPQQPMYSQLHPGTSVPQQVSSHKFESDLQSPAVQAFQAVQSLPVEQLRQLLENIRLSKGDSHVITSEDFEPYIN